LQVPRERDGGVADGRGVAGQTLHRRDERVEMRLQRADPRAELILGVLGDGLRAAVGRTGNLLGQPRLRVVERGLEPLR
jgi:hypothetical protein